MKGIDKQRLASCRKNNKDKRRIVLNWKNFAWWYSSFFKIKIKINLIRNRRWILGLVLVDLVKKKERQV